MTQPPLSLTYSDVSLVPVRSRIGSRSLVSTRTRFTTGIELAVPIVSANMDTVTTAPMAIALAQAGGLGVVHRGMTVEAEAAEVAKVKRYLNYVVAEPYLVAAGETVARARELAAAAGVTGLVVTLGGRLGGLLTARDLRAAEAEDDAVERWMTPRERLITAPAGIGAGEARRLMLDGRIEKLPLVDGDDRVVGLVTLRDIEHTLRYPAATRDRQGRLRCAAAVGVRGDYLERAGELVRAGADALVLDVAHGHAEHVLAAAEELKERLPGVELVVGNVATEDGVRDAVAAGADGVKVGIGPGAACTTRIVAGTGVPQWSAVHNCAVAAHELDVPFCADGGIREPGDVAKAIGAGASTAMIGSLFAGRPESPGEVIRRGDRLYKAYRGMASAAATSERRVIAGDPGQVDPYVEGTEMEFELRGPVAEKIDELVRGLRSAMSYSDAADVAEFWEKATFVHQTSEGRRESHPIGSGD